MANKQLSTTHKRVSMSRTTLAGGLVDVELGPEQMRAALMRIASDARFAPTQKAKQKSPSTVLPIKELAGNPPAEASASARSHAHAAG